METSFPSDTLAVLLPPTGDEGMWMPGPRAAFQELAMVFEARHAGRKVAVWPRAASALSDVPSTSAFMRAHEAWGLVLEPAALLTEEMATRAGEHLERIVSSLASHERLVGMILPQSGSALDACFRCETASRPGVWEARRV